VAAAVILPADFNSGGIADSKELTAIKRQQAYITITNRAVCYAVSSSTVAEIDKLNILQASLLAMRRAVAKLPMQPDYLLIDGNRLVPDVKQQQQAVVGGDNKVVSIASASILAKVHRDKIMLRYHKRFPEYGFDRHKGYPTKMHRLMLIRYGALTVHRKSFNLYGEPHNLGLGL
jgi:ribonuclease HII